MNVQVQSFATERFAVPLSPNASDLGRPPAGTADTDRAEGASALRADGDSPPVEAWTLSFRCLRIHYPLEEERPALVLPLILRGDHNRRTILIYRERS